MGLRDLLGQECRGERGRRGERGAMRLYDARYVENDLSDVYIRKEVGLQHV